MKVIYDTQIFDLQKFGGISRYFYKLIKENQDAYEYILTGKYSENIYAKEVAKFKPFPIKYNFRGKSRIEKFLNKRDTKKQIIMENYDVYHPTYYYIDQYPKNKPVVITAHDFIHELFPMYNKKYPAIAMAKQKALAKADKIIAISNTTKKDLLSLYPFIKEDKIDVIHHAIEWNFRNKQKANREIQRPYILFTGLRSGYKNFNLFIKAVSPLLLKYDLDLFCTGVPFTKNEQERIYAEHIESRINVSFVDENELRALYENALCFVFPSLYEGFGLPILEAFVSNCPVVLANTSCFPEIGADAALYFDPYDPIDMRNKIEQIIISETLRNELIIKGIQRFKDFSMDNMINKTLSTYNKLL